MYAEDYTLDELMVVTLARQLKNGEVVMYGVSSIIPEVACMLAKETHAPNIVYISLLAINPRPIRLKASTDHFSLTENAVQYSNLLKFFEYAQGGRVDVMFFSGAQIDRLGNVNLSVIGEYDKPKVRLPGGAGSSIICHTAKRILLWFPKHAKRNFPEKVDFITIPGYLPQVKKRMDKIVTSLAVLGFDEKTGLMKLISVHPSVKLEEVVENTGFDLVIPDRVPVTDPPTAKEIEILRSRIDPENIRTKGL